MDRSWELESEHGTQRLQQWSAILYHFDSDYTNKIFVQDFRPDENLGRKFPDFRPINKDFRLVLISSLDLKMIFVSSLFRP